MILCHQSRLAKRHVLGTSSFCLIGRNWKRNGVLPNISFIHQTDCCDQRKGRRALLRLLTEMSYILVFQAHNTELYNLRVSSVRFSRFKSELSITFQCIETPLGLVLYNSIHNSYTMLRLCRYMYRKSLAFLQCSQICFVFISENVNLTSNLLLSPDFCEIL